MSRIKTGLLIAAACAATVSGCSGTMSFTGDAPRVAEINHVVLIWLHDPSRGADVIEDADRTIPAIDGVYAYSSGTHIDVGRDSVESGYDAGFYIGFRTTEAYESYIDDPDHVALVDRWSDEIERLVVYDFGVE